MCFVPCTLSPRVYFQQVCSFPLILSTLVPAPIKGSALKPDKCYIFCQSDSLSAGHFTSLHYSVMHTLHCIHYTAYTTLYLTTLHYTSLHCISLQYTVLHFTALHHTTLHYTTLHYTALHYSKLS